MEEQAKPKLEIVPPTPEELDKEEPTKPKLEIVPPTPEELGEEERGSPATGKTTKLKPATPETDDDLAAVLPMSVGDPDAAASLAIDQSHMEDFASSEEISSDVVCDKPPKGVFFTVRREPVKPWKDRAYYFVLQIKDRDPYIVAPKIAKQRKDEDVIRPVLLVRYVTMAGDEGLWPVKLDPPDGKSNSWNRSALAALATASEGKWVRLISAKGHYRYQISPRTLVDTPPRFSARTFQQLVNLAFPKDQTVTSLDHEIWEVLDRGSDK